MKKDYIKKLLPSELDMIESLRLIMLEKIRNVPENGIEIEYLDKKFRVYKNVFWPGEDSKALVENLKIYPGETVLDVGTGSGIISIFSAYKGASKVVAVDINPDAINTAKINIATHGFDQMIDVRLSDMFESIKKEEKFDIITSNPPMSYRKSSDFVDSSMYDTDFRFHKTLFEGATKHLKKNGRMYIAQANFGAVNRMFDIAKSMKFKIECVGRNIIPNDFRIFYVFKLERKYK